MRNVNRHILVVLGLMMAWAAPASAQWDVTETNQSTTIKDLKSKKTDIKMEKSDSVSMQADQMEYSGGENQAKASGNVTVTSGTTVLTADHVELNRTTQEANASGHVYVDAPQFKVDADNGIFNLKDKTGDFSNARIFKDPFQIKGESVAKVSDDHVIMENGYMTTCDHDQPHFRMAMNRLDFYQGDKAVARGVKVFIGPFPVMYIPQYTQNLRDKPWFTFTPGYKKDLGFFLLTRSRIKINEYVSTTLLVDAYERQGFAWGSETKYHTPAMGAGLLRTYFINERAIEAKHPWNEKTAPTTQNERYRLEWRHKWDIDRQTQAIWQYYRLSDNILLNKYFEKEYRRDPGADTYFLLTKALPVGTVSFRVDHRVNRFVEAVDRTPEVNYTASAVPMGSSGFYLKTNNTLSNLVKREASPTEDRRKTLRADSDNEISYPTHVAFVQVTPLVGGDATYYSRTNDDRHPTDVVRGMFKTGVDISTRFMKVFNVDKGFLGTKITKLRHIIAPTVSYRYQHEPSFAATRLNQFDDAIDGLTQKHVISFSLENKIQGKRGSRTVDLIRAVTSADYNVKQKGAAGNLGPIKNLIEFTPVDWFRVVSETTFDHRKLRLSESNLDMYFVNGNRFGFSIGDRFARGQNEQFVTQVAWVINPKWRFKVYESFEPFSRLNLKEQKYSLTRDLHEWEVSLMYDQNRGSGTEVMMAFTLKAFPEQPLDLFGTTFHQRKAGSQSDTETQF